MAYFLVKYNGGVYANDELYINAIAGGEHAFMKMLAGQSVEKALLMDQILYHLTEAQVKVCESYDHTLQDFDEAFRHINLVAKNEIKRVKEGTSQAFPGASVIAITSALAPPLYTYRQAYFFKVQDWKPKEYRLVEKMASIKICGRLYTALNAVNIRVEAPIIVTIDL